ncbi:MAG: beta-galactosidase [Prevotella sp.]|jgi:beta-galactosidase|nr:beta-galactosidase [Prevotella sp.]MCI1686129.1 beta-galactosidase [Prevotella sp.]MCI1781578.1 beta-galactosidase [Prevotella sp.]MCI1802148.1 beta-galactosidase [Prevotella sp.]MCI1816841.1 beta-galactosidase [Prevotella sp.]
MKNTKLLLLIGILLSVVAQPVIGKSRHTFSIANGSFLYDGKPIQIHSGEMHYARVPAPYWHQRLKMMKAMGLNTVATYVFWNYQETSPGVWDWTTGNHNLRAFVKAAAEEGMMVILRPGPYSCAEWEYGGYPWWLHKVKGLIIRSYNRPFLDSCRVYINQLASQVKDLQVTHGGPIIMVQAENEFGSYVSQRKDIPLAMHKKYSAAIHQELLDAGFDVPMFTADGSWLFSGGAIEGALPAANGEDNVDNLKKAVNAYHGGEGPYMVSEFYPGWLDHWNEPFQKVSTEKVVNQIRKYLDAGVSFNFYMIHGGTNFGFTSGANYSNDRNIQPDLTSYDYDAPISEAGWATPKYNALRNLMMKYVKHKLPQVPARIPVIAIPHIRFDKTVDVFGLLKNIKAVGNEEPLTFEELNQGYGYVVYRRRFTSAASGMMKVPGIADYGIVYVNGMKTGELNRMTGRDSMEVEIPIGGVLDILVENMGRINYGARITDNNKGITKPVTIGGDTITGNWKMYKLPMDKVPGMAGYPESYQSGLPVLYHGTFSLRKVGDTFLDMSGWGKGIVFVNGINLGRYWKVGPQQTLYLPGCFLKKGKNQIIVFEQQNDSRKLELSGVREPVLDKLGGL